MAFAVATRMSPEEVGNRIVWTVNGPGYAGPTVIASDVESIAPEFSPAGSFTVTSEVTADTYIVKPQRTGANLDVVQWSVTATGVAEVSRQAGRERRLSRAGTLTALSFQDVSAAHHNVDVSKSPGIAPFPVSVAADGKRGCAVATVPDGVGRRRIPAYDLDAGILAPGNMLFVLVTADDGPATEGSLGGDSFGQERSDDSRCAR